MNKRDNFIGFEFLCRACDCVNNEQPICKVHSERRPVIIGLQGRCIHYTKAEDAVRSFDEDRL